MSERKSGELEREMGHTQMVQRPGWGQAEATSQDLHLGFPRWVERAQALDWSSAASSGTLAWSWIRTTAVNTQKSAVIWDTSGAKGGLSGYTITPAACWNSWEFLRELDDTLVEDSSAVVTQLPLAGVTGLGSSFRWDLSYPCASSDLNSPLFHNRSTLPDGHSCSSFFCSGAMKLDWVPNGWTIKPT